jgi:SSS family solute:Na+ symporter
VRALDLLVLGVYFAALAGIGWWVGHGKRGDSERDLLVGDRQIPWWAVLLSVLGSEISALTFVGVPAFAYTGNWTYLQVTLGAIGGRYLVGRFFVPAFYRHNVVSIYEFLLRRYGPWTRNAAVLVFLFARVLMSGVRLGAGAVIVHLALGIPTNTAIVVVALVGLVFCAVGGVKAVVWTEVLQVSVMLIGAFSALLVLAWGTRGMSLPPGATQVVDLTWDPGLEFTLWAALLGTTLTNAAIFGTDYDMVQRMLTAKNSQQSGRAVIGSALAEIPIISLFLGIGSLLRLFYQAHPDPHLPTSAKQIFGYFIITQLPAGLCGLLIAAVISVLLSSYESALASLAGSFVVDLYRPFRPDREPGHYLWATRLATFGFASLLLVVAVVSGDVEEILKLGLEIGTYFYGALLAVFGLALIRSEERPAGWDRWTALVAMPAAIALVLAVKVRGGLAFPWYVSLGAAAATVLILLPQQLFSKAGPRSFS